MPYSVTLYTMPADEHCKHVISLLEELHVAYNEVQVSGDERIVDELEKKTGQLSVPALVVTDADDTENPQHVVVGYESGLIRKIFELKD